MKIETKAFLLVIVLAAVVSAPLYFQWGQAATISETMAYNEDTLFRGVSNLFLKGVKIGQQGEGGVTFFNGTIINETTTDGEGNPVTVGDKMRIDDIIYRIESGGDHPLKIADTILPDSSGAYSLGSDSKKFHDLYLDGALYGSGVVGTDNLADDSVTSAKISAKAVRTADLDDAAVTNAKLEQNAVTSEKISDGTIKSSDLKNSAVTNAKLSDDSVTPSKINGTGGANLPIAYGLCESDGSTAGGTSNVSCEWDAVNEWYEITISGVTYDYLSYLAYVTPIGDEGCIADTGESDDKLRVRFVDKNDVEQATYFSFIVYEMP